MATAAVFCEAVAASSAFQSGAEEGTVTLVPSVGDVWTVTVAAVLWGETRRGKLRLGLKESDRILYTATPQLLATSKAC